MSIDLTPRLRAAADYLEAHGWVKGVERTEAGRVCLTGAVRYCQPQTGDEYLIREVLRQRDRAEDWNDSKERTADEVVEFLRTAEVTDTDLEATFGPQWREIVTLVRQATTLTPEQVDALAAAWVGAAGAAEAAGRAAWVAAGAAWVAAGDAGRAAGDAAGALVAARDAAGDAGRAAWVAAGAAAAALVTRDLIGTHGYTREHFQLLIGPWASVMGMPEPAVS